MISITKPRMLAILGGDVQSPGIKVTGDPNVLLGIGGSRPARS
jgi:hypothetical protein